MTTYRLAVVAGDGIGPEVVAEGLKCLAAATEGTDLVFETTEFDLGARRWHATGDTLTSEDLEDIGGHDVILLGDFNANFRQSDLYVGDAFQGYGLMAVGDFHEDGIPDVVINPHLTFLGNGNGGFELAGDPVATRVAPACSSGRCASHQADAAWRS